MQENVKSKWRVKLLRGVALTLALLCLLFGVFAWWLLSTTSGARWLIGSALPYAQQYLPDSLQLDIEGIEADTIANLSVQRLTLADSEGIWFEGKDLHLAWHPTALWRGELHLGELSAQRLHYLRPPIETTEETSPQEQLASLRDTLQQLPDLLSGEALPALRIDRLAISELAMENAVYTLSGNADLVQRPIQLNLTLDSVEGIETSAKIALNATIITVQWREASGGLLGTMLALQPAPLQVEITSSLQGNTLIADLQSTAGDKPLLTGQINLPLVAEGALSADLQLANPALLEPLASFQRPINLEASLTDNTLELKFATEQAQGLRNTMLESRLDFADVDEMRLTAKARAELEGGKPLEFLLGAVLEDDTLEVTRLLVTAPDTITQATGSLDMDGDAQLSGIVSTPQLDARFEAEGSNLFDKPEAQLEIVLEKLKTALPAPFDTVLAAPLTLTAQTQENDKAWPDVALKVESAHINGDGMIDPNALEEQAMAQGKIDVTGLPLPITLAAEHRASGTGHLHAASRELLAETDYRLKSHFLHLSNLHLEAGQTIRLAGEATVDTEALLAEGKLNGRITTTQSLLDLGLDVPLVTAADGAVSLSLAHPDKEQQVALTFYGGKMTLDGQPLTDNATLNAQMKLPEKAEIQIAASTEINGLKYPVEWDAITLKAEGPANQLAWSLNAKNNAPAATLSADGELRLTEAMVLFLNSLNAQWQKNRLKLQKPAELSYAPDKITLNGLDLRLNDSASLQATAALGAEKTEGTIEIAKLPVKSLPFGNTAMLEGTLNGKLFFFRKSVQSPRRAERGTGWAATELSRHDHHT